MCTNTRWTTLSPVQSTTSYIPHTLHTSPSNFEALCSKCHSSMKGQKSPLLVVESPHRWHHPMFLICIANFYIQNPQAYYAVLHRKASFAIAWWLHTWQKSTFRFQCLTLQSYTWGIALDLQGLWIHGKTLHSNSTTSMCSHTHEGLL